MTEFRTTSFQYETPLTELGERALLVCRSVQEIPL